MYKKKNMHDLNSPRNDRRIGSNPCMVPIASVACDQSRVPRITCGVCAVKGVEMR